MNALEYGNTIRVTANEDISVNTNILTLISPSPVVTKLEIGTAEGLTIGAVTQTIDGIVFTAGEYVEYITTEGDIFIAGEWSARLFSQTPDMKICKITNSALLFIVNP